MLSFMRFDRFNSVKLFPYKSFEFLNFLSDVACVWWATWYPRYVLAFDLVLDDNLQTGLFVLFIKVVKIEHVVPKFMVLVFIMSL